MKSVFIRRQLISSDQAVPARCQHKRPCSDCPWARKSLHGWLGSLTVQEWLQLAHGEGSAECHALTGVDCAGLAIYRANVCKTPRDPRALRLPADRNLVFSTPSEFRDHHDSISISLEDDDEEED